ncbi:MAG: hypothetical protein IT497_09830 [Ottowia sp.]|nr:hypothetical protein [Ottowia sp.]
MFESDSCHIKNRQGTLLESNLALIDDLSCLEKRFDAVFKSAEARFDSNLEKFERRLTIKLGSIMVLGVVITAILSEVSR